MTKQKTLFIFAIVVVVGIIIVSLLISRNKNNNTNQSSHSNFNQILGEVALAQKMQQTEIKKDIEKRDIVGVQRGIVMSEAVYTHRAMLTDVSGGKGTGIVNVGYSDETYNLSASFANLIEPQNDDFYEGWIVRREPFEFMSTGKVEKLGGVYSNLYQSKTNLMAYDFYVLTIEPDDGDPAPGVHILEGVLTEK